MTLVFLPFLLVFLLVGYCAPFRIVRALCLAAVLAVVGGFALTAVTCLGPDKGCSGVPATIAAGLLLPAAFSMAIGLVGQAWRRMASSAPSSREGWSPADTRLKQLYSLSLAALALTSVIAVLRVAATGSPSLLLFALPTSGLAAGLFAARLARMWGPRGWWLPTMTRAQQWQLRGATGLLLLVAVVRLVLEIPGLGVALVRTLLAGHANWVALLSSPGMLLVAGLVCSIELQRYGQFVKLVDRR